MSRLKPRPTKQSARMPAGSPLRTQDKPALRNAPGPRQKRGRPGLQDEPQPEWLCYRAGQKPPGPLMPSLPSGASRLGRERALGDTESDKSSGRPELQAGKNQKQIPRAAVGMIAFPGLTIEECRMTRPKAESKKQIPCHSPP